MLVLILLGVITILWLLNRKKVHTDEPPLSNSSKILIGNALQFAGDSKHLWSTIKNLTKEALERGGVLKTTIGPRTLYVLTNPEDCLTVSNTCLQKDVIYEFAKPWIGDGLLTSSPSRWKVQRKHLNPAFAQHILDSFIEVFNNKSRSLVNNLKVEVGKGPFDHWIYTKYNALETVCLTTLGVDLKEKSTANTEYVLALAKVLNALITRFQTFWLHNNFIFSLSSLKRRQDNYIKALHKMGDNILRQRKEQFTKNASKVQQNNEEAKGSKFKPFMELLLELAYETNTFTDREIREQVDTMIVAGHDTFAAVLTFCMLFVGSNPKVQEKIHEELKNIFGDEDKDVTKEDLSQLMYLEAVIKETMRFCPTVPVVGRYLDRDVKLRNSTLYKGNSAFLFIYGIHRHSMWGPDVEEFKPDRWLDPSTLPNCAHALAGFGIGRRNCIGQTYAMMSMKVALAHIYRNFIVHGDNTKLKLKLDVTLKPVSGHYISIVKRK